MPALRSILWFHRVLGMILAVVLLLSLPGIQAQADGAPLGRHLEVPVSVQSASSSAPWAISLGGNGFDYAHGLALDPSGNILLTGLFWMTADFGGGPMTSTGYDDIFIAKYAPDGTHLWSRQFGSTWNDEGSDTITDQDGNIYLTGGFSRTVNFGGGNFTSFLGTEDLFLVKLDADGNHIWSKGFGNNGRDLGTSLAVDSARNVYLTGYFNYGVNFGSGMLYSAGNEDIFIVKYDPNGSPLWSKRFGGAGRDYAYAIALDPNDNLYLTGSFEGSVDFGGGTLTSAGADDIFLAKFDSSGNHVWSRRFGGSTIDEGSAITTDSAGSVFLTGFFEGSADFGGGILTSAGYRDIFLAKFDASGNHQWSKRFGGASYDYGFNLVTDSGGNVWMTGGFVSNVDFGGGILGNIDTGDGEYQDAFLAKYNPDGKHLWSRRFGGHGSDHGSELALDPSGVLLMAGKYSEKINFGLGDLDITGGKEIFLAKYGFFNDLYLPLIHKTQ